MHLLIDVRTSSPADVPYVHYGHLWADEWLRFHPHDTITFLAHDDDLIEGYECVRVSSKWSIFPKRIAHHRHGPSRVVSFSRLSPYDTSIPHLVHVSDISPLIYPIEPLSTISHKLRVFDYKKLFREANHIILPHLDIGTGISELFSVDEKKMSVIPYLRAVDGEIMKHRTILPHGIYGDYLLAEGTPSDEWRPLDLLETYGQYVHRLGGAEKLIIIGNLGENLGSIMTMIRTLDLLDFVKIIGVLTRDERGLLYSHARGWIYAGSYYSRGPSAALANGYHTPLIFSDIPGLRDYTGRYFHPNHIDRLPELLARPYENPEEKKYPSNDIIMEVYTRLLAE